MSNLTDLQRLGQEFDATDLAALTFEPHAGYGQDFGDPDMRMPFGYLSGRGFNPLFELDHFFDCPEETLTAYAKLFAAAPCMFDAASRLLAVFDELQSKTRAERIITGQSEADLRRRSDEAVADLRAAITKATSV